MSESLEDAAYQNAFTRFLFSYCASALEEVLKQEDETAHYSVGIKCVAVGDACGYPAK